MPSNVRAQLSAAAEIALVDRRGRGFIKAVRTFVTALQRVPQGGPLDYSHEQLVTIRDLSERVAIEIDDRIDDADDSDRIQQELAQTVETIRRIVEAIHVLERHFLQA